MNNKDLDLLLLRHTQAGGGWSCEGEGFICFLALVPSSIVSRVCCRGSDLGLETGSVSFSLGSPDQACYLNIATKTACSRSRRPCHCMLWVRGMSWSHYMHPIPPQVIWMAPNSNPICETCLLLATCFHGQNSMPCPPTHMASGHSTRMKLIKKVREVSEWYDDTQIAL